MSEMHFQDTNAMRDASGMRQCVYSVHFMRTNQRILTRAGVAIFWLASKFGLVDGPLLVFEPHTHMLTPCARFLSLREHCHALAGPGFISMGKGKSAVQVQLSRRDDGALLAVHCAHLKSGDKAADECKRIQEIEVLRSALNSQTCLQATSLTLLHCPALLRYCFF